jgi:hypothetical protein
MDVTKLTQGQKIAAGSAILLFIVMFFSWFGAPESDLTAVANAAGVDTNFNAWQSFDFIDLVLLVTIVVAVGAAALVASGSAVNLPVPPGVLTTLLGGLSTLLVLYRILDPPSSLDRKWGVFLGLILAGAITYGGWRTMEEEGSSFGDAADRLSGGGGGGGGSRDRGGPGTGPPSGGPPPPPSSPPPPPPPPPPSGS